MTGVVGDGGGGADGYYGATVGNPDGTLAKGDTPSEEDRESAAKFAYHDNKSPFDNRPTQCTASSTTGKPARELMHPREKLPKCLPV